MGQNLATLSEIEDIRHTKFYTQTSEDPVYVDASQFLNRHPVERGLIVAQHVLAYITPVNDLKNMSMVSKSFHKLVKTKLWSHIKKLTSFEELSQVKHLPITKLSLQSCDYSEHWLDIISQFTCLQSLILGRNLVQNTSPDDIKVISHLPIQELSMAACRIHNDHLAALHGLSHLLKLDLSQNYEKLTDSGLTHLSAFKHLAHLDLSWCRNITSAGMPHIAALTELRYLDITGCGKITAEGLESVSHLHIEELRIYSSRLDDSYIAAISPMYNNLKALSISNDVTKGNAGITEIGVVFLSALTSLNTLDIRQCRNITESALDGIKQLPIQNILTDTL